MQKLFETFERIHDVTNKLTITKEEEEEKRDSKVFT